MFTNHKLNHLLMEIHRALEDYLYPICNKCHTKSTVRSCDCEKKTPQTGEVK